MKRRKLKNYSRRFSPKTTNSQELPKGVQEVKAKTQYSLNELQLKNQTAKKEPTKTNCRGYVLFKQAPSQIKKKRNLKL